METLKIEILNPKALKLIKGMQDLKLIKVSNEPVSEIKTYLNRMRRKSGTVPTEDEISKIVEEVRSEK